MITGIKICKEYRAYRPEVPASKEMSELGVKAHLTIYYIAFLLPTSAQGARQDEKLA
jgi:hypothetical protein